MYKATQTQEIKEFYDEHLKTHAPEESSPHYHWLLNLIRPVKGLKFLDVACGPGFMLLEAVSAGLEVFGIDISPVAVELAKKNAPGASVEVGDGENLPWPSDNFDYVTSLGSLEHYLNPQKGIAEIARVLKPGGTACIMLPNTHNLNEIMTVIATGDAPADEQDGISRTATRRAWQEMIEQNGLKVKRACRQNEFHPLFARKQGKIKVKSFRKFSKSLFIKLFCPLNLAEHFVFIAEKK